MKSKVLLLGLICTALLFSSCLTLTTGLVHQSSGAGRISLDYKISKKAAGIQKDSVTGENLIPLPVNRSDFEELAAVTPGISLESFSESEDTDSVTISAGLNYQSLNDLAQFFGFPVDYSSSGNTETLVLSIYKPEGTPDTKTLSIINSLFADDVLTFEMTFPRNIRSSSFGEISGRTVRFSIPLPDVYKRDDFVWTLEW